MTDIGKAIFARAGIHAGLSALIGSRMYPVEAPQKTAIPYVTYQVISPVRDHAMSADGLGLPRVQFDCWAKNRADAMDVRDQILACFDRWSGIAGGITVDSSVCENDGMDVQTDDITRIPRVTLEFQMSYVL